MLLFIKNSRKRKQSNFWLLILKKIEFQEEKAANSGMSEDEARKLMREFFPKLKRWKKALL
ncbi:MAG TPA: zinc ribbon domain-containing protein [Bacillota bacterium]